MYKKVMALRSHFEPVIFDLAALYEKQGKTDRAIALYRDYYQENPARFKIKIKIAELLIREKKNEEAIAEYRDLLRLTPKIVKKG